MQRRRLHPHKLERRTLRTMKTYNLQRELVVPATIDEVFAFFGEPENLERLTPPLLSFNIRDVSERPLRAGTLIRYRLRVRGIPMGWTTLISHWDPPHGFVDEQLKGPYRLWHHTHTFEEHPDGTLVRDHVRYAMWGGALIRKLFVERDLERIFDFRTQTLKELFGEVEHGPHAQAG